MSRSSRAGNEFAGFLPQASTDDPLPLPPFPPLPATGLSGSLRPLFYLRRILVATNSLPCSVTISAEGGGEACTPPARARDPARHFNSHARFILNLFLTSRNHAFRNIFLKYLYCRRNVARHAEIRNLITKIQITF